MDQLIYADSHPVLLHGDLQAKNLIVHGGEPASSRAIAVFATVCLLWRRV